MRAPSLRPSQSALSISGPYSLREHLGQAQRDAEGWAALGRRA